MMTTFLFNSNYDKLHLLYAGGSHVSTLECFYDCLLDYMFLFLPKQTYSYIIFIFLGVGGLDSIICYNNNNNNIFGLNTSI